MLFFITIILLVIWFSMSRKRTSYLQEKKKENFWEKESNANHTRKTSLECLNYITIPLNLIELAGSSTDSSIMEQGKILKQLSNKKIVNLTGISNTDLKLKYGSSNLSSLTEYDQNFTQLAQTLNCIGLRFSELEDDSSAILILEFSVSCKSDISSTYKQLAQLYVNVGQAEKIDSLIESAKTLNSLMKNTILIHLEAIKKSSHALK
jgi:hypothetical protein